jgi:hypothetical protein
VPEHTIVTPMEQWKNGYFVTVFEWRGLHWQLMQHGVHGPDALYTRLNYKSRNGDSNILWKNEAAWRFLFPNMHYHLEWDGIISVEAAVQILDMLSKVHAAGVDHGRADMQKDIRKMIGMDK